MNVCTMYVCNMYYVCNMHARNMYVCIMHVCTMYVGAMYVCTTYYVCSSGPLGANYFKNSSEHEV